jgi:hypothetical protein
VFERFTRDEVSSWVWWPATMLLVVLVVLTFPGENRAIDQRREAAATRAWSLTTGTIAPTLEDVSAAPLAGEASAGLAAVVADRVLADAWTDTVRIWAADSTLLWSSAANDPVGSAGGLNDDEITRALADITRADQVVSERDLDGRPADATFSAYVPFVLGGDIVAAQLEVADATLLGEVRGDWLGYRIVFGLAALLALAFAIGSMREPLARIGVGVPFYPTSLPPATDVIEMDRRLDLERAGGNARERVAHMEARLRESEELRLRAEGELQRALSQLANRSGRPTRSVIPRSTAEGTDPRSALADEPLAAAAEPVTAGTSSTAEPVSEMPAGPSPDTAEPAAEVPARSKRASEKPAAEKPAAEKPAAESPATERPATEAPTRERPARTKPAADVPDGTPASPAAGASEGLTLVPPLAQPPAPAPTPPKRPRRIEPAPTAARAASDATPPAEPSPPREADRESGEARRTTERIHPSRRRRAAASTWEPTSGRRAPEGSRDGDGDIVVVPDPTPRPASGRPASPPVVLPPSETIEATDGEAREVLERLVDPVAAAVVPAADPSVLRAKLARTAALKKPGSRERLADDPTDA